MTELCREGVNRGTYVRIRVDLWILGAEAGAMATFSVCVVSLRLTGSRVS